MSKYDALRRFLRRRPPGEVMLTFTDIERLIGAILPKAASSPGWWANTPGTDRRSVQCGAWLEAGYHAFPGLKESVTFRLKTESSSFRPGASEALGKRSAPPAGYGRGGV